MAKFTVETKVRAAQDYLTGLDSQKGIARCYVMSRQVLQQWIDFYQHHGEYGLWKRYTNYTALYERDWGVPLRSPCVTAGDKMVLPHFW